MGAHWQTVRVFISSTFRDMQAERDYLVRVTFPQLREALYADRIYVDDIDLRWGVTKEQAENDRVLDICLDQIDACRPFFLCLLGERYGWVPQQLPESAVKKFGWLAEHLGKSVTELEIIHGVLNKPPAEVEAFFYFRDPSFIEHLPDSWRNVFLEGPSAEEVAHHGWELAQQQAAIRREWLEKLKEEVRRQRNRYFLLDGYPCRWDPTAANHGDQPGKLIGLEAFGESVQRQLEQAIRRVPELQRHFQQQRQGEEARYEAGDHNRFVEARLRTFIERDDLLSRLEGYIDGPADEVGLVVGNSGSGKTTTLARMVEDYRPKEGWRVFSHFVGAARQSASVPALLERLCRWLRKEFDLSGEIPPDPSRMRDALLQLLQELPQDLQALIIVDGLDQLEQAPAAALDWLPRKLPPRVRILVSAASDSENLLEEFKRRPHYQVAVEELSNAERRRIIAMLPSLSAKTLDADQVDMLLANPATANPLFLTVALEELRGFGSFEKLNQRILAFPRQTNAVAALFDQVLTRLEQDFGPHFVAATLAYLAASRRGMAERELRELTEGMPNSENLFPLLRQLRPYLLRRGELLDFYHRALKEAVTKRYFPNAKAAQETHACLAEYFAAQDDDSNRLTSLAISEAAKLAFRLPNERKADELLWQRLQAGQLDQAVELVEDLSWLELKVEAGQAFELLDEYRQVRRRLPDGHSHHERLRLLELTLATDIHFLDAHPGAVLQCFWNRCWWFDCPQADQHFQSSGEQEANSLSQTRSSADLPLYKLMEQWRARKEATNPGYIWLRALRPLPDYLQSLPPVTIRPKVGSMPVVAITPQGDIITDDNDQLALWSTTTNRRIRTLPNKFEIVARIDVSPDGARACIMGHGASPYLVDLNTGQLVGWLGDHRQSLSEPIWSPDGATIVACANHPVGERQSEEETDSETIRVWSRDGEELLSIDAEKDADVAHFSPDGQFLLAGDDREGCWSIETGHRHPDPPWKKKGESFLGFSRDGAQVFLWNMAEENEDFRNSQEERIVCYSMITRDCATGGRVATFEHRAPHSGIEVALDPNRQRIAFYDQCTIDFYDVPSGKKMFQWRAPDGNLEAVKFFPDGRRLATVSRVSLSCTIRIWDLADLTPYQLVGHDAHVDYGPGGVRFHAAFTKDGQHLATKIFSEILIWRASEGRVIHRLHPDFSKYGEVSDLAFSDQGDLLAICGDEDVVELWEPQSGRRVRRLNTPSRPEKLAFSPDGNLLAVGGANGDLFLYNVDQSSLIHTLAELRNEQEHAAPVDQVVFSPDSEKIAAVGNRQNRLCVWNAATGKLTRTLSEPVKGEVEFSSDGTMLCSTSEDAVCWSLERGRRLTRQESAAARRPGRPAIQAKNTLLNHFQLECRPLKTTVASFEFPRDVLASFSQQPLANSHEDVWVLHRGPHVALLKAEGKRFPDSPAEILQRLTQAVGVDRADWLLAAFVLARQGLRTGDLYGVMEVLEPEADHRWIQKAGAVLTGLIGWREDQTALSFANLEMRDTARRHIQAKSALQSDVHLALHRHFSSLPPDDPWWPNEAIWHALEAENWEGVAQFLARPLSVQEAEVACSEVAAWLVRQEEPRFSVAVKAIAQLPLTAHLSPQQQHRLARQCLQPLSDALDAYELEPVNLAWTTAVRDVLISSTSAADAPRQWLLDRVRAEISCAALHHPEKAVKLLRPVVEFARQQIELKDDEDSWRAAHVSALRALGLALTWIEDDESPALVLKKAMDAATEAPEVNPQNIEIRRENVKLFGAIADWHVQMQIYDKAVDFYDMCAITLQPEVQRHPRNVEIACTLLDMQPAWIEAGMKVKPVEGGVIHYIMTLDLGEMLARTNAHSAEMQEAWAKLLESFLRLRESEQGDESVAAALAKVRGIGESKWLGDAAPLEEYARDARRKAFQLSQKPPHHRKERGRMLFKSLYYYAKKLCAVDPKGAIMICEEAAATVRNLLDEDPRDHRLPLALTRALRLQGTSLFAEKRFVETIDAYNEITALCERARARFPQEKWPTRSGFTTHLDLFATYRKLGDKEACKRHMEAGIALGAQVLEKGEDAYVENGLAGLYFELGSMYLQQQRYEEAMSAYQGALPLRVRQMKAKPDDRLAMQRVANLHQQFAKTERLRKRFPQALAAQTTAQELLHNWLENHPDDATSLHRLGANLTGLQEIYSAAGQTVEAIAAQHNAVDFFRTAAEKTNDADLQHSLAQALETQGDLSAEQKGAAASYREAVQIYQAALNQQPDNAQWRRDLAGCREKLLRTATE